VWYSSSRGARVELLLQVVESHLYFLVNFMIYLYYQCELLNVCVFKVKTCCVNCQMMKLSLIKER
jgi:hypothetical protein